MRGVPGSGKSSSARWVASLNGVGCDQFWKENCITYFGRPSLSWIVQDLAKRGLSSDHISADEYGHEHNVKAAIHSTDEYFMVGDEYRFNPTKLGLYHNKNYKAFRKSIDKEVPLVIVDNTNSTRREWCKYQNYAEDEGYWVSFHVMPHPTLADAVARNSHNVPADVIKKMIKRFE